MSEFYPFIIFGLIILTFILVGTYNKFIKYRNMIEEGWSIIDVALKRRANLIPKLISSVEGYIKHEASVLKETTDQRLGGGEDRQSVGKSETVVSRSLGSLLGVAEAYPDLKASANFIELQNALNIVEKEIANSRNQFNMRVRFMNTLVEQFPSNIVAMIFNFEREEYFEIELATERDMPSTPWDSK